MSDKAKASTGISESLLRISVGIEDPEDLWADLEQALDSAQAVRREPAEAGVPARSRA